MRPCGVPCDQCYTTLWNQTLCFLFFVLVVFFFVLSQQQEHIVTRLHCSRFSVEKNKSYELILYNEQKSNRYLQQMF